MNRYPKISVITPSYNKGKYIEQAIQSVLLQKYPYFEHVIVDGGSTDNTLEILKKYPHLKWISEPDMGQSNAMNKGLRMATGEILVYLNADDYFEPNAFREVAEYLNSQKNVLFVAGDCRILFSDGRVIHSKPRVSFLSILQWWNFDFPLNSSTYFYSPRIHNKIGLFNENNENIMDYDFLLRVSQHFKIHRINTILGNYRVMPGCKSVDNAKQNLIDLQKKSMYFQKNLNILARLYVILLFNFKYKKCHLKIVGKPLKLFCKLYHALNNK
jgi:glycosyltransferase involved in cell wall biosynthesis